MGAGRQLPSGTVTFLFTDIERSTQTVEAMGNEAYADALDTHRQLLREAFKAHDGHEIGTEGDSFFVAFGRPRDAVAAATDGQSALTGHDLSVRMGLHTGDAVVRHGGYVGHDVHKAKRICDAGHGGQILLSAATADLVDATLVDLGPHRLKDLGEPERLHQLVVSGFRRDFPPLRSLAHFIHNLPPQRTTFVGRERELTELRDLIAHHALVTLIGVGGCGKTRLALQVGADLLDEYPDGVFFVDLAPIADPSVIVPSVAVTVGLSVGADAGAGPSAPIDELLIAHLSRRKTMIILDNCEHLLDACADLADLVLGRCTDVTITATSREPLDVQGEQTWRVPSLSLPRDGSDVQSSEAVSLFKTRARAVRPDFDLTPQNVDAVAEICRRLDGIPLAIEFAASRVSHMSPQEIAARLSDLFRLLTGGRHRVQRQQTLETALDWSYGLLTDGERLLLRRLAVFSGSFTLDAAEGICAEGAQDVLNGLASLVAKSLVTTDEQAGRTRYRLIETVRQYAAKKLHEAGEADSFRTRHRDWYQTWVESHSWEEVFRPYSDRRPPNWLEEHSNLRAALEWSDAESKPELAVRMAARLWRLWVFSGFYDEGYRWLELAKSPDIDVPSEDRTASLCGATILALLLSDAAAADFAERAVDSAEGRQSVPFARALAWRGITRAIRSAVEHDPELAAPARSDIEKAIDVGRSIGCHMTELYQSPATSRSFSETCRQPRTPSAVFRRVRP